MATVDGVLTEIRDMAKIAEKRSDKPQLLMGLATSISSKVATIKAFGAGQADQLYEAIRVLPSEYQELVSTSVDDRLRGGLSSRGASFTSYQHMRFMTNYLTQKDWSEIGAANGDAATIIGAIVRRLHRLGVKSPSDGGLVKWVVAITCHEIFAKTKAWPTYRGSYVMSHDVKTQLSLLKPRTNMPHIESYPEFPSYLPKAVFDIAYEADDQPIACAIMRLESIANHVVLRKDNKHLVDEDRRAAVQSTSPLAAALTLLQTTTSDNAGITFPSSGSYNGFGSQHGPISCTSWPQHNALSWKPHEASGDVQCAVSPSLAAQFQPKLRGRITLAAPRPSSSPLPLALTDGTTAEDDAPLPKSSKATTSDRVAAPHTKGIPARTYEAAAFQALVDQKAKKTAAAAAKRKSKKDVAKRPAAAVAKTPAAPAAVQKYTPPKAVPWGPKEHSALSRNTFTCRAYNAAERQMKTAGIDCKSDYFAAERKRVLKLAGETWDMHMKPSKRKI